MVACPFSQFDGTRFYDPQFVRDYRKKLLEYVRTGSRGFGLNFKGQVRDFDVYFLDNHWILTSYSIDDVQISTSVYVSGTGEVVQSTTLNSTSSRFASFDYALCLSISVNRASYGQLTEGGSIPIPLLENHFLLFDFGKNGPSLIETWMQWLKGVSTLMGWQSISAPN